MKISKVGIRKITEYNRNIKKSIRNSNGTDEKKTIQRTLIKHSNQWRNERRRTNDRKK